MPYIPRAKTSFAPTTFARFDVKSPGVSEPTSEPISDTTTDAVGVPPASPVRDRPPLELESPPAGAEVFRPDGPSDRRPHMPQPLPVRLIAVADVRLAAPRILDVARLDAFYLDLLQFQRTLAAPGQLAYLAENFTLYFDLLDSPLPHESIRPLGIDVLSLPRVEHILIDTETEYTRQRGTTPGRETLLVLDPAGNWVEIGQVRLIA